MTHPIVPLKTYVSVYCTLIVFTILTVAISEVDLGEWNVVAALAIAVVKGSLVVWFFMHLKHAQSLTRLFAAAGLFWLAILIALTLADFGTRSWFPDGRWW